MADKHPEFPTYVRVSSVDVDSGSVWVGDPCYVIRDTEEDRARDLGKDWHGVCSRFSERSGYETAQEQWQEAQHKRDFAMFDAPEWQALMERRKASPETATVETLKFMTEYREAHPLPEIDRSADVGFANFTHDLGHGGLGTMINTLHGDGSFPVFIEYQDGRPRRILIDFDPPAEPANEDASDG